jgi:nitroimidazol reductase NimA-like FMN-containing flavoprotein (pyridoxamine 5'-phosphate oxidase superfamily)
MGTGSKVIEFLKRNQLAAFSTLDPKTDTPQTAFVYYIVDEDNSLYIGTSKNSRKIKNIARNKKVGLAIADDNKAVELQLEGKAEIIKDLTKKRQVISLLADVANKNESSHFPPLYLLNPKGLEFIHVVVTSYKYSEFTQKPKPHIITGHSLT